MPHKTIWTKKLSGTMGETWKEINYNLLKGKVTGWNEAKTQGKYG
jgi:hypothetical protein